MYCGIAERRGRVHGCACAVGLASAVQGACIGCAFVCCWPQGWGARCWVQVRLLSLCSGGDGRMQFGGRFLAKPGEARGRVVLGRWCTCICIWAGAGRPAVGWSLGLLGDFEFQHSSAGMATSGAAAAACCCSSPLLNTAPHAPFRRSFVISGRSGGSWTGVKILENT